MSGGGVCTAGAPNVVQGRWRGRDCCVVTAYNTQKYTHTYIHSYIHTYTTLIGNPITTGTAREGERVGIEPLTGHTAIHGVDRSAIQLAVCGRVRRYKVWRGREGRTTCSVPVGS